MYRKVKKRKFPMYPESCLQKKMLLLKLEQNYISLKLTGETLLEDFPLVPVFTFLVHLSFLNHLSGRISSPPCGVVTHISVSAFAQSCSFLNIADVFSIIIRVLSLIQRLSWQSITWSKWRFWLLYVPFSTGHYLFSACNLSRLE